MEEVRWQAALISMPHHRDLGTLLGGRVVLVDSVREKNKARAVVEIFLETGAIPTPGLHPFDTTKTKIKK